MGKVSRKAIADMMLRLSDGVHIETVKDNALTILALKALHDVLPEGQEVPLYDAPEEAKVPEVVVEEPPKKRPKRWANKFPLAEGTGPDGHQCISEPGTYPGRYAALQECRQAWRRLSGGWDLFGPAGTRVYACATEKQARVYVRTGKLP